MGQNYDAPNMRAPDAIPSDIVLEDDPRATRVTFSRYQCDSSLIALFHHLVRQLEKGLLHHPLGLHRP